MVFKHLSFILSVIDGVHLSWEVKHATLLQWMLGALRVIDGCQHLSSVVGILTTSWRSRSRLLILVFIGQFPLASQTVMPVLRLRFSSRREPLISSLSSAYASAGNTVVSDQPSNREQLRVIMVAAVSDKMRTLFKRIDVSFEHGVDGIAS